MVSTLPLLPLILILLALRVVANPVVVEKSPINLKLARRLSLPGTSTIADRDRSHAKALLKTRTQRYAAAQAGTVDVPVTNAVVAFTMNAEVGSTNYTLIVDTGSSNTWIGSDKPYNCLGGKSRPDGNFVILGYGSGFFLGTECIDKVTLGGDLSISNQSIGAAKFTKGFQGVDGILGIGPVNLTVGTLFPEVDEAVPTVTDNLYDQKTIGQKTVGIYFFPNGSDVYGELTFGGTDTTKYVGDITYTGITSESPASEYWGIDQSITYGNMKTILSSTAGIVDTGTTLVLLASDAFATYREATGATLDNSTGLLKINQTQYNDLHNLTFHIGREEFKMTPNAQIWPRSLNTEIGGDKDAIYLIVGDLGTNSGQGLDFINGYAFLERFYSVYDGSDNRVGFAPTNYTFATTN